MAAGDAHVTDDDLTPPPGVRALAAAPAQPVLRSERSRRHALALVLLAVWGPGLIVMLAGSSCWPAPTPAA